MPVLNTQALAAACQTVDAVDLEHAVHQVDLDGAVRVQTEVLRSPAGIGIVS